MRLSLQTVLALVAVVGAGAFAAGRSLGPAPAATPSATTTTVASEDDGLLPAGHPPTTELGGRAADELPPGHPPLDPSDPTAAAVAPPDVPAGSSLEWTAPARWQSIPNASTMRLATYRVPHLATDTEDAELTVTQAGGSVDANARRWIAQFDPPAEKTAKRTTRRVGALEIIIVEVQGNMTASPSMGAPLR